MSHIVNICDPGQTELHEMIDYCLDHNLSLLKFDCIDISDFSLTHDTIATFTFQNPEDATVFKLKYF